MDYPTFLDLKKMALSCKNRKKGKMLTSSFRLWYDDTRNTVKLVSRYDETIFMETDQNDLTTVLIPSTHISGWITSKVNTMYGVYFKSLQGYPGIKRHNSHTVRTNTNNETYIYIPYLTVICNGTMIDIANYKEDIIDKTWKNEYAQISKKNRAAFTALHNIIPFDTFDTVDKKPKSLLYNYHQNMFSWSATNNDITGIIDMILNTKEPNANHIEIVRKKLNITSNKVNLRTVLQKLINEQRYDRAKKDGKISTISTPNYAR